MTLGESPMAARLPAAQHRQILHASLAAGGRVNHPLLTEFFGTHGNLTDRFGIDGMPTFEPPRA